MGLKKLLFIILLITALSKNQETQAHRWGFGAGFGYGLLGGAIVSNAYNRYPCYPYYNPFYCEYYPAYYLGYYPYYYYY